MVENDSINYIKIAFDFQSKGQIKQAIEYLYKALENDPNNAEVISQIAFLYNLAKNYEHSIKYYERAFEISKSKEILLELVEIYSKIDSFEKMKYCLDKFLQEWQLSLSQYIRCQKAFLEMQKYEELLQFHNMCNFSKSKENEVLENVAEAYYKTGDIDLAKNILLSVINSCKSLRAEYLISEIYYSEKQYEKAKDFLKKVIISEPTDKVYNLMGEIELETENIFRAIENFRFALNLNPDNYKYYYNLGCCYFENGLLNEAQNLLKKAIELNENDIKVRYAYAELLFKMNNYEESIAEIDFILQNDSNNLPAKLLYSNICLAQFNLIKAKNILEDINSSKIENEILSYNLSKVYCGFEIWSKAIKHIKKAIEFNANSFEYKNELAYYLYKNNMFEDSKTITKEIVANNSLYMPSHILLAKIYFKFEQFQNALDEINCAIDLDLNYSQNYLIKSKILVELGEFQEAVKNAKLAVKLSLNKAEYYLNLGNIYFEADDFKNAIEYYKEALKIESLNIEATQKCYLCSQKLKNKNDIAKYKSVLTRLKKAIK